MNVLGAASPGGDGVSTEGRSRRVLHVLAPAGFGGLEQVVHSLAAEQRASGTDARVLALTNAGAPEPPSVGRLRASGVPVLAVMLPPRAYRAQWRALAAAYHEQRPDVVHTHGYLPDVLAAISSSRRHSRLVSTVHGFTGGDLKNRIYEHLQLRAYRRFDAVVAVSRRLGEQLAASGVDRARVFAVPNALVSATPLDRAAAHAALRLSGDTFTIGWVGRTSREKGLDIMIEALRRIQDLRVHLEVFGDGPETAGLQRQAADLGVGHLISWRGVVENAAQYMRAFDVLVMSSRTEGTPMVLLEAMNAEVPIVATAVGGIPDVVSADEALLVAPEQPDALATAIRAVHDNRTASAMHARRARKRLDKYFSAARWVDAYARIYDIIRTSAAGTRT